MGNNRHNSQVGRKGEDLACRFLMDRGHTILERNWRSGHLELDIVSIDTNGIHFVEVKSRCAPFGTPPQESVTTAKQKKLYEAARRFLARRDSRLDTYGEECHFDIFSVVFDRETTRTEYIQDAFIPGLWI